MGIMHGIPDDRRFEEPSGRVVGQDHKEVPVAIGSGPSLGAAPEEPDLLGSELGHKLVEYRPENRDFVTSDGSDHGRFLVPLRLFDSSVVACAGSISHPSMKGR